MVQFLLHAPGFERAWSKYQHELQVDQWLTESQRMRPVAAAVGWNTPQIESSGALAEWLGVTSGELRWFADLKGLAYKNNRPLLRHYHYRVLVKQSGGL